MMRKYAILIMTVLLPLFSAAQKWSVSGEVFYGTFKMKTMKELQNNIRTSERYDFQVVSAFPAYVGYNFLAGYSVSRRISLGLRFQYTSTGGRIDYGDYSGQLTYDQLLHGYSLGISSSYRITKSSNWEAYLSFTTGAMRTSLTNVTTYQLFDETSGYSTKFQSFNYFFNPGATLNRKLGGHLTLYATLGYEFQIHRALRLPDNKKQYLKTSNGTDVTAEWDGIRLGAGISYRFSLSKKNRQKS